MCLPLMAQESTYPTENALNAVKIPANNPIDLARRLRGIDAIHIPPTQPNWVIGDSQFFNAVNSTQQQEFIVNAELRGMSEHVLVWVEASAPISDRLAQQFAEVVDASIVQQVQSLWGFVEPVGIDGDSRFYILMTTGLDKDIAGYFADIHSYPRSVIPNSNQHEMVVYNLSAIGNYDILSSRVLSTIAHEYQHILRHFIDSNESTWLDEGFSTYTEHHIGWDPTRSQVISFLMRPNVQINQWVSDTMRFPRYGATFLLVNYLVEQYGLDALRMLSNEPADGWTGLDLVLKEVAGQPADDFFADWVLANYFLNVDTGYGYKTLWNDLPSARPLASIVNYPYQITGNLPQYSTDYYTALNFGEATSLTLTVTQPDHVKLIPTTAFEGDHFYYSVPADSSDVTLTRSFDLSEITSATMTFRTWYDIEEFWDYGYVMASADDGETWDILGGTTSRTSNPYNRAYGEGYTGQSFGWVQESISLDQYAGKEVLIRFEVITDAASIRHGMAIDDIRIDAVGYKDSFETDSGLWDKQGWIRTDNRLPPRTWIQAVQQVGNDLTVSRWLIESDSEYTIDLIENVEQVLIAISPISPQTMVDTSYTLDVKKR
jgi:immune inhibitor A